MNLPDAAAEFARQFVIALAGNAGREVRTDEVTVEPPKVDAELLEQLRRARAEREREDELKRARSLAREAEERAKIWIDYWHRIEKLVGREFTSPESVIDRVAYLAEQEGQRDSLVAELKAQRREHAETAKELIRAAQQRDELLQAARVLPDQAMLTSPAVVHLRDLVDRIERELAGP